MENRLVWVTFEQQQKNWKWKINKNSTEKHENDKCLNTPKSVWAFELFFLWRNKKTHKSFHKIQEESCRKQVSRALFS